MPQRRRWLRKPAHQSAYCHKLQKIRCQCTQETADEHQWFQDARRRFLGAQPSLFAYVFAHTEYDDETRNLMEAALNTAWMTLCARLAPSEVDRAAMVAAIIDAVAKGERDFMRLQQKALDALAVLALVKAVDRRKSIRLASGTDDPAVERRKQVRPVSGIDSI